MKINRRRVREGWRYHLEPVPGLYVGATSDDAATALHSAAKMLDQALANPAVQAVMPPGTLAAAKILRGAAAAVRRGNLDEYMQRLPTAAAHSAVRLIRKVLPW